MTHGRITDLRNELSDIAKRIAAIEKILDDAIPNWDNETFNLALAMDEIDTAIEKVDEAIAHDEEGT